MFGAGEDESVDQLLEKLAKKGKKIKILDESTAEIDGEVQQEIREEIQIGQVNNARSKPQVHKKNNKRTIIRAS